jgi:hypothetical protein
MAMTGGEHSKKLRDEEKAKGIQRLLMKLTPTERGWIQRGQEIGQFEDPTEFLLAATKAYVEQSSAAN